MSKVVLLYPPEQTWPEMMCKPNGSLAYPALGGALLSAGIDVSIFDACVGNSKDDLDTVFYRSSDLPTGMKRTGVSNDRILEEVYDADVIGLTSIFTHQETMVLSVSRLIKEAFPEKLIVAGGVNARHRQHRFFRNGVDVICTSEAEDAFVKVVRRFESGKKEFSHIPGVSYLMDEIVCHSKLDINVIQNLDDLPMAAWHLLPNNRYWKIRRPHGGHFLPDEDLKYASMMTSRGCPFRCTYCHISGELKGSISGDIGSFRIKSDERVLAEIELLKTLGVRQIFIEDDSIFGKKKRAIRLINKIRDLDVEILDVNGINVIHLLKNGEPDDEVIETLAAAGFRDIALPFESISNRILLKYASNKWNPDRSNIPALINTCKKNGIRVAGNFMIGYPDETRDEAINTINFAKKCMDDGLDASSFFLVMPLPGTPLFDYAIRNDNLPVDYNPDRMHWQKANMINTLIPPSDLEEIRDKAWQELNHSSYTKYKKGMIVDKNTGEIHKVEK